MVFRSILIGLLSSQLALAQPEMQGSETSDPISSLTYEDLYAEMTKKVIDHTLKLKMNGIDEREQIREFIVFSALEEELRRLDPELMESTQPYLDYVKNQGEAIDAEYLAQLKAYEMLKERIEQGDYNPNAKAGTAGALAFMLWIGGDQFLHFWEQRALNRAAFFPEYLAGSDQVNEIEQLDRVLRRVRGVLEGRSPTIDLSEISVENLPGPLKKDFLRLKRLLDLRNSSNTQIFLARLSEHSWVHSVVMDEVSDTVVIRFYSPLGEERTVVTRKAVGLNKFRVLRDLVLDQKQSQAKELAKSHIRKILPQRLINDNWSQIQSKITRALGSTVHSLKDLLKDFATPAKPITKDFRNRTIRRRFLKTRVAGTFVLLSAAIGLTLYSREGEPSPPDRKEIEEHYQEEYPLSPSLKEMKSELEAFVRKIAGDNADWMLRAMRGNVEAKLVIDQYVIDENFKEQFQKAVENQDRLKEVGVHYEGVLKEAYGQVVASTLLELQVFGLFDEREIRWHYAKQLPHLNYVLNLASQPENQFFENETWPQELRGSIEDKLQKQSQKQEDSE